MNIAIVSTVSLLLYTIGTAYQSLIYRGKLQSRQSWSFVIGIIAVSLQAAVTYSLIVEQGGLDFGFFKTMSLVASTIVLFLLILSLQKPLQSIFIAAYPVAAVSLVGTLIFHSKNSTQIPFDPGIFAHIVLSITAYSVFSIASLQALLIVMQNHNLKKKSNILLIRNLPPLMTMESLLFELLRAGLILYTGAILLGFIFIEDLFAQHLAHKTFFSIASWLCFAFLLYGRARFGWRGVTASKWTLAGSILLMVGFLGSKLVLDLII